MRADRRSVLSAVISFVGLGAILPGSASAGDAHKGRQRRRAKRVARRNVRECIAGWDGDTSDCLEERVACCDKDGLRNPDKARRAYCTCTEALCSHCNRCDECIRPLRA